MTLSFCKERAASKLRRVIYLLGVVWLFCAGQNFESARAQGIMLDPGRSITQYPLTSWTTDNGLPQNSVNVIHQTRDGYLWFGTQEGLARFDGRNFFVYNRRNSPLRNNFVTALFEDARGALWIGTHGGGLYYLYHGRFTRITEKDGLTSQIIGAILIDSAGDLWVGTDNGLFRRHLGRFEHISKTRGLPGSEITTIVEDASGYLWFGSRDAGVSRYRDGHYISYRAANGLCGDDVTALATSGQDALWVGTLQHGLCRLQDGRIQRVSLGNENSSHGILALYEDPQGSLWIGSVHGGLMRLSGGRLSSLSVSQGLVHDVVRSLYRDREGSLWIGTDGGGLNQIWNGKFTSYTVNEGLPHNYVFSVYEDHRGAVWVGTEGGGVTRLENGKLTSFTTANGLSSDVIISLAGTRDGSLWVGTYSEGLNRIQNGRISTYRKADGLPDEGIYAMYEDRRGDLWIGTEHGLARYQNGVFSTSKAFRNLSVTSIAEDPKGQLVVGTFDAGLNVIANGKVVARYNSTHGLASNIVLAIYSDREATWIGTQEGGLYRLKNGHLTAYREKDGLPAETILHILEDRKGRIWLTSNQGLFSVTKQELNAFAEGKIKKISPLRYGKSDGLPTLEFNGGVQPAGWIGRDGRLWFATSKGLLVVDPEHLSLNTLPPPVHIQSIVVDSKIYPVNGMVRLPAGSKRIEFHYAGLSFLAPYNVRYRYKLEGVDTAWVEAGANRDAFYMNLAPGRYRFRVMASNNDGVWNEEGDTIEVYLAPFFYQTVWFYLVSTLVLLGLAAAVYQMRVTRLKKRQRELEELVDARTFELRKEKEETERAKHVIEQQADQLRELDRMKTRFFSNVSHEFRTPLTLNIGPLENALSGFYGAVSPELRKQMEVMLRNARRLLRLINQLLDLSKLDSGRMKLKVQRRDLNAFAEGIVLSFTPFTEKNQVNLEFTSDVHKLEMYFDPEGMEKILFNLLSNAVKFTPSGGSIHLSLSCQDYQENGDSKVEIKVRDTGCGIPEEELPYVFDRFHQVNGVMSKVQEGTGIGLALVKELVTLHGGTISVTSEAGSGAEFTILIPRNVEQLPDIEIQQTPESSSQPVTLGPMVEMAVFQRDESPEDSTPQEMPQEDVAPGPHPVILVVDDDPDIREYLESSLRRHYDTITAENGEEGYEVARRTNPDLIISDVMMPKMDGYGLCRAVRADAEIAQTPFILVTSRVSIDDKIEGLEAGADDYLAKPFNAQELLARVKNLLILRTHEKALSRANDALREAIDMKNHVLRIVAHDLRNPLNGIRELAKIIRDGHATVNDQAGLLDLIVDASNQMFQLIQQMVEAEALESGTIKLDRKPIRIDTVAESVAERYRMPAQQKGQHLHVELQDERLVEANEEWLSAAMDNLINNAVKYSPQGKDIHISVTRHDNATRFAVQDEGPGLTEQDKEKLFQKFQRLSARPTGGESSTGLGLAIVKKIVDLHNGRVWAESDPGHGSTFIIEIPTSEEV